MCGGGRLYYESRVTHKGFVGNELIGGKTVMKLNNIHFFCSHTCSLDDIIAGVTTISMHDNCSLIYKIQ